MISVQCPSYFNIYEFLLVLTVDSHSRRGLYKLTCDTLSSLDFFSFGKKKLQYSGMLGYWPTGWVIEPALGHITAYFIQVLSCLLRLSPGLVESVKAKVQ